MARYLLSVHTAGGDPTSMTAEEIQEGHARVRGLEEEMTEAGALVFSGRLREPTTARVVRARKGRVVTTDGPFLEAKESIGGFYIIEAAGSEAALDWASRTSTAIGMPVEVRPFWEDPRS